MMPVLREERSRRGGMSRLLAAVFLAAAALTANAAGAAETKIIDYGYSENAGWMAGSHGGVESAWGREWCGAKV